jgi:deoxyribodipyrimidine photo-lyase
VVQVVWFKRDLRTIDHVPLATAARQGPIIPLYIVEPDYWSGSDVSARQWLAIRPALEELNERLTTLGSPLVVRVGNAVEILSEIYASHNFTSIIAHQETGNVFTFKRDIAVRSFCSSRNIKFIEIRQFGVFRALETRDAWASLHNQHIAKSVVPEPIALSSVSGVVSQKLPTPRELGLSDDGCLNPQPGTRHNALALMKSFFNGRGVDYRRAMSKPLEGRFACSRLSVSLSTGAISIRETLQRCAKEHEQLAMHVAQERPIPLTAIDSLVARLHWHCHFIQKLESEPELEWRAQHPIHEASRVTSEPTSTLLNAWATGQTGLPFVDACMRSLIATGWLNFRMRAMVQSVASYHLSLNWRASGERLARLFTDYEPGIHWSQVQMQSGQTGINIPRIYNPVKQGYDQDPDGTFTRLWLPELAKVPLRFLQEPWLLDTQALEAAGVRLGSDYPSRVVDHIEAAREAKKMLTAIRAQAGYRTEATGVFIRHGSRKRPPSKKTPKLTQSNLSSKKNKTKQLTFDL